MAEIYTFSNKTWDESFNILWNNQFSLELTEGLVAEKQTVLQEYSSWSKQWNKVWQEGSIAPEFDLLWYMGCWD